MAKTAKNSQRKVLFGSFIKKILDNYIFVYICKCENVIGKYNKRNRGFIPLKETSLNVYLPTVLAGFVI